MLIPVMMLGNVNTRMLEIKLDITLEDTDREILENSRQINATNIEPGKWHCFERPFVISCGCKDTVDNIKFILSRYTMYLKDLKIIVENLD